MSDISPPDPEVKARELVVAVRAKGLDYFTDSIHAPDLDIDPNEYWHVTVKRVKLAPVRYDLRQAVSLAVPEFAWEGVA